MESAQYFETSQVLNNKHMNPSILKWSCPLIKAFETETFSTHTAPNAGRQEGCLHWP